MKEFTDESTATRTEKAKRVLRALANPHDYKYFHGDGFPRQADLMKDAAAALEVLEALEKKVPNAIELTGARRASERNEV